MTAYASNWMTTTSRSDQVALQPLRGSQGGGGAPLATYRWPESPLLKICPRSNDNNNSNTHIDESSVSLLEDRVGPNCARSHPFHAFIQGASRVRLFGWPVDRSLGTFALGQLNRSTRKRDAPYPYIVRSRRTADIADRRLYVAIGRRARLHGRPREGPEFKRKPAFQCET
jgi:hypothetical protein